jgi:hypothetical protein
MLKIKITLTVCLGLWLFANPGLTFSQTQSARTVAPANPASDKAQFEMDFWRSTERVDTPEAYAAYLEAFPNGRFASLARAAIKKVQVVVPVNKESGMAIAPQSIQTKPALPAENRLERKSQLAAYSEEINTGSVELRAGDRLNGPVKLVVGGMGAKKQVLVPRGEWVVLAGADYNMMIPANVQTRELPVRFSTIFLAQFDSDKAVSALFITYNRTVTPSVLVSWPDAAKCEGNENSALFLGKEGDFTLRRCHMVQVVSDPNLRRSSASAFWNDADASLRGLRGVLGQFNLESSLFITSSRDYLRVSRFDCTQRASDGGCQSLSDFTRSVALKSPNVETRIAWLKAYLPFAVTGFKRDLDDEDSLKTVQAKTMLPD